MAELAQPYLIPKYVYTMDSVINFALIWFGIWSIFIAITIFRKFRKKDLED
jgi:hypothetical protein